MCKTINHLKRCFEGSTSIVFLLLLDGYQLCNGGVCLLWKWRDGGYVESTFTLLFQHHKHHHDHHLQQHQHHHHTNINTSTPSHQHEHQQHHQQHHHTKHHHTKYMNVNRIITPPPSTARHHHCQSGFVTFGVCGYTAPQSCLRRSHFVSSFFLLKSGRGSPEWKEKWNGSQHTPVWFDVAATVADRVCGSKNQRLYVCKEERASVNFWWQNGNGALCASEAYCLNRLMNGFRVTSHGGDAIFEITNHLQYPRRIRKE